MKEILIITILLASQYLLILIALKICEWQSGKRLFLDSFIFLVATMGAYFAYMPFLISLKMHHAPVYFFFLVVAYMTFGVGAVTLWAIRKLRAESVLGTRPAFAAFAATVGFVSPIATFILWNYLRSAL